MEDRKELYEAQMKSFEWTAFFYELPYFLAALVAGGAVGALYALVVMHYRQSLDLYTPLYFLMAIVFCGIVFMFWAASYYPFRVKVFPDRLWFKMMFGKRELKKEDILSISPLSEKETRRTLTSLRYRSLCPAISGAVLLQRSKGRPWVINFADRESFLKAVEVLHIEGTEEVSRGSV